MTNFRRSHTAGIRYEQWNYPLFDVTRVMMDAGATFECPIPENDKCVGVVCLLGGTVHVNPGELIDMPQVGDGLFLNDETTGWSNDHVGHHDVALYAPKDTIWVCIAENGHGRPALGFERVQNEYLATTGFVAISGELSVGGRTLDQDEYIDHGALIGGHGEIILITSPSP